MGKIIGYAGGHFETGKLFSQSVLSVFLCLMLIAMTTGAEAFVMGDVNADERIDTGDVVAALQIAVQSASVAACPEDCKTADVNGDGRIGIEEAVYALQVTAGVIIPGMTARERSALDNTANYTVLSLARGEKYFEKLDLIADILAYTNLHRMPFLTTAFPCDNADSESVFQTILDSSGKMLFDFAEGSVCEDITGTLEADGSHPAYDIEYRDMQAGDCLINGISTVKFSTENDRTTADISFDNMFVCGEKLEGNTVISYDDAGTLLSAESESRVIYSIDDSAAIVSASLSYSHSQGISGTTGVDTGMETNTCEFSSITTDSEFGLPVSGTLSVNGAEVDFGGISPDYPVATATFNDANFDMNLEAAGNAYLSGNVQQSVDTARNRAALMLVDGCTTLLNEFRQKAVEEMEAELERNLEQALRCLEYERPVYEYEVDGVWLAYDGIDTNAMPVAGIAPEYAVGDSVSEPAKQEGASEYSETNTQVEGVDEADFVKNDGSYVYILADGKFRIIDAWPPEQANMISSSDIEGSPKKLFVHNQKVFVYSSLEPASSDEYGYYYGYDEECTYGYNCDFRGDGKELKITILDISALESPTLVRELYFSGSYLNSRRIGNAVHSVIVFPEPRIQGIEYWPEDVSGCWMPYYWYDYGKRYSYIYDPWYYDEPEYTEEELRAKFEELKKRNKELILNSDISDWLPSVRDIRYADGQKQESEGLLGDCEGFYVSAQQKAKSFLAMVSTDISGTGELNTTSIVGEPGAVYASSSAFYICSRHQHAPQILWFFDSGNGISEASTIHKFDLSNDPPASTYAGSGAVKGRVLNQFSMDEHEGFFRIATTTGRAPGSDTHSTVSVLEDKDGELEVIGQVDEIAPTEDIRSARFDRDRGYIVTFKKTDPLFVLDLSEPANPAIAGELKIPGFSTYIHRMDDNHLISIGYDTEESDSGNFAWFQGIMLQIFDVSDMSTPRLTHKEIIGTRGSTSDAATNHLAFNFFSPKELLAIPMVICEGGSGGGAYGDMMTFSGLMVYKVTNESGFEYLGGVSHDAPETSESYRGACSNWWTDSNSKVKRSIFMDDYVFSITEDEIRINLVSELGTDIAVISLEE